MGAENGTDGVSTATMPPGYINRDELLSLRVVAGTKRIFLALCENDRGRYLKISDGRVKLIVPGSGIPDLRSAIDGLHTAADALAETGTPAATDSSASRSAQPEPLHAERFIAEGRKFYLDLLENERGSYVKMSQATTRRTSMTFPASALRHLRDAMAQLVELAPPDPCVLNPASTGHITRTVDRQTPSQAGGTVTIKAVQRELRVEGKRVVFESGANRRGSYLRITETNGVSKMSVTIPHSTIPQVLNLLNEVQDAGDPLEDLRAAEDAAAAANANAAQQ